MIPVPRHITSIPASPFPLRADRSRLDLAVQLAPRLGRARRPPRKNPALAHCRMPFSTSFSSRLAARTRTHRCRTPRRSVPRCRSTSSVRAGSSCTMSCLPAAAAARAIFCSRGLQARLRSYLCRPTPGHPRRSPLYSNPSSPPGCGPS